MRLSIKTCPITHPKPQREVKSPIDQSEPFPDFRDWEKDGRSLIVKLRCGEPPAALFLALWRKLLGGKTQLRDKRRVLEHSRPWFQMMLRLLHPNLKQIDSVNQWIPNPSSLHLWVRCASFNSLTGTAGFVFLSWSSHSEPTRDKLQNSLQLCVFISKVRELNRTCSSWLYSVTKALPDCWRPPWPPVRIITVPTWTIYNFPHSFLFLITMSHIFTHKDWFIKLKWLFSMYITIYAASLYCVPTWYQVRHFIYCFQSL